MGVRIFGTSSPFGKWAHGIASLLLAGTLAQAQGKPASAGQEARSSRICFCADAFADAQDPALRRLEGCWIVAGPEGIQALDPEGEAVPVPALPRLAPGSPCSAVAVLPPGSEPCPAGAPRLVYGGEDSRIFALDLDGASRELSLGGAGESKRRPPVRDLALDRKGSVFVVFGGDRGIWRVGLAGDVTLHARIPPRPQDGGDGDLPDGFLSRALDPATGDLYTGDPSRVRGATPAGAEGMPACPAAAPARPVSAVHLAVTHDGMRLQVAAEGMDPAQSDGRPRGRGQPKSKAEKLAARQKTRARARAHAERFREEYRQYRKASRLSRKQEARERAEAEAAWDVLQCMQRELPAPGAPVRARTSSSLMGLAGVALLGVTAFYEPSVMWAMAQEAGATPYPTPAMANLMTDQATALLAQLGPVCALARLVAPAPCASGFRAGLVTEAAAIQANTARLFVDPKVLGAGVCLKGETTGEKKERVALAQGSIVADYTAAAAAAQAFSSLLNGASWGLYAAGTALFAGEEAAQAAGAGATGLAGTADFDAQEVGDSLIGASYALQAAAGIYTMIGYDFGDYSAGYRLWANSVTKGLLKNCTGTFPAVSPSTGPPLSFTGYPSPIPAMEDAMLQLAAGCRLAQRQGLALPICSPATFNNLGARNSTLGPIAQGTSCLAFGVVPGTQSPCRLAPEADSRGRSDVSSKFAAFTAELNAAAAALQAVGDGLASGASGLTITGNAALRAGNATAADALLAAAGGLDTIGAVLFVDGYALVRTGALAQQVAAGITLKFNADSLAALNGRESTRASSTGAGTALNAIGTATGGPQAGTETGPGELASSGSDEDAGPYSVDSSVGGDGGAGPWPGAGTAGTAPVSSPESSSAVIVVPDSSTAPAEPSASAATRTTPLSLRGLVQRLLPPPPGAWPVHGEF